MAVVHCQSIKATFEDCLPEYVKGRPLDHCETTMERCLSDPARTTMALLHGDQIMGFAAVAPSQEEDMRGVAGLLDRIYLHPSVCGAGLGNKLMYWAEDEIKGQGFSRMTLWVFAVNKRARHFYQKHGYEPDGSTKEDFGSTFLRYSKGLI